MNTKEKLTLLRNTMSEQGIAACIIPNTDPHLSEYTPDRWKTRQWISGFTGSAGTVVVTHLAAGLWTDSRYFLQATNELDSEITLFRDGLAETPSLTDWLSATLEAGDTVGIDGQVFATSDVSTLQCALSEKSIKLNTSFAPFDTIWTDRPKLPLDPCFILPEEFAGKSAQEKIAEVVDKVESAGMNATLIGSLDMTAWLLNLRGSDVAYNPVFLSYVYLSHQETVLFVDPKKLSEETIDYLREQQVVVADYERIHYFVSRLKPDTKLLLTPSKLNYSLRSAIPTACTVKEVPFHPIDLLKAAKNDTELNGFREAMKRDGAAMVRLLRWLEKSIQEGNQPTELDVMDRLGRFRQEQPLFFGESFNTIAGYGANGAIVHYAATPESNTTLQPEGFLLLDSGGQYFDGTTDITRTIALGPLTDEMCRDYTNVLKGMIALARARFPEGTYGSQIDVLARQFLWQSGENYLHGTGHGIGHFLNVHEGPQSIRMNHVPLALVPGMVTSDEPGIYKDGRYGIRIENLVVVEKDNHPGFLHFDTLTLCPIDQRALLPSMLTRDETEWLNAYHRRVYEQLSPLLNTDEQQWLEKATQELTYKD